MQSIIDTTRESSFNAQELPVGDLVMANQLEYPLLQPISAVVQRRFINYDTNVDYQSNGNITLYTSTGDDYVNYPTSFISFKLSGFTGATGILTFDSLVAGDDLSENLVSNIFKQIRITHSSGTTICTGRELGAYIRAKHRWYYDKLWRDTVGSAMGSDVSNLLSNDLDRTFVIPLYILHGFFSSNKLCPSFASSGLKIELQLNTAQEALHSDTDPATDFKVSEFKIHLDQFTLMDSVQSYLNEASAKGEIAYNHKSYAWNSTVASSTKVNLTIDQAMSQAVNCMALTRLNNNVSSGTARSYAPDNRLRKAQVKIGSNYFPQTELDATNKKEAIMYMWNINNSRKGRHNASNVPFNVYKGVNNVGEQGIINFSLERSSTLNLSGHFVSGSRNLTYMAENLVNDLRVDLFVEYYQVNRLYLFDKVVVLT